MGRAHDDARGRGRGARGPDRRARCASATRGSPRDELGRLLEELQPFGEDAPLRLRRGRADPRREARPREGAPRADRASHRDRARRGSIAEQAWREAKERSDFELFLPHLERNVYLKLRYAHCFEREDPYDPLLDDFEPGMKTARDGERPRRPEGRAAAARRRASPSARRASTTRSFAGGSRPTSSARWSAAARRAPMPGRVLAPRRDRPPVPDEPLADATCGSRPATTSSDLEAAIFSALHEYGHGLYENGVDPALDARRSAGRPRSACTSRRAACGRTCVGRSLPFWQRFYPLLGESFPNSSTASARRVSSAPSTRSSRRSSGSRRTSSPTTSTSCCGSSSSGS